MTMAMGSASEMEYFLLLARDLHYLPREKYLNRLVSKVQAERGTSFQRTAAAAV